jgi:hypothetical protein
MFHAAARPVLYMFRGGQVRTNHHARAYRRHIATRPLDSLPGGRGARIRTGVHAAPAAMLGLVANGAPAGGAQPHPKQRAPCGLIVHRIYGAAPPPPLLLLRQSRRKSQARPSASPVDTRLPELPIPRY